VVFCGPSLARKGAYELREALRESGRTLLLLNQGTLETGKFWEGFNVARAAGDWLAQAAVVVQPAFVENAPRPLLRALAAGLPVIATPECGIESRPNLFLVPAGDVEALREAINAALTGAAHKMPGGAPSRDLTRNHP
jgi:glycosyltransferase involved in cell wall biosynthesis